MDSPIASSSRAGVSATSAAKRPNGALPADSRVWFAERNSAWKLLTYAGEWTSAPASELSTVSSQGPVQTMPLLYETADGLHLMVTEAALYEYSGMPAVRQ